QNGGRATFLEVHARAEYRRERSASGSARAHSRLALRGPRELVPMCVREQHQIAAAYDEWLALPFPVHPRLAAPHQVKYDTGCAGGVQRPAPAVTALLEDAPAQAERLQDVRQKIAIRCFGHEISCFGTQSPAPPGRTYSCIAERTRPVPALTKETHR